jgi:glycerol kinase
MSVVKERIKPCPFCGKPGQVEEITTAIMDCVRKSVGCVTEECQGYQSNATFATRREAIKAWNKRARRPIA